MFYSEDTALWGFIAHIPLAIILLMFLSRQITLRQQGISLTRTIFNEGNKKVIGRAFVGGLFGLILIITLSPISRLILS